MLRLLNVFMVLVMSQRLCRSPLQLPGRYATSENSTHFFFLSFYREPFCFRFPECATAVLLVYTAAGWARVYLRSCRPLCIGSLDSPVHEVCNAPSVLAVLQCFSEQPKGLIRVLFGPFCFSACFQRTPPIRCESAKQRSPGDEGVRVLIQTLPSIRSQARVVGCVEKPTTCIRGRRIQKRRSPGYMTDLTHTTAEVVQCPSKSRRNFSNASTGRDEHA